MKTTQKFIEDAINVHGNKYDYSKSNYKGCFELICIICPEHGEFWQQAHSHLNGRGCPICGKFIKSYKNSNDFFIKRAKEIHGNKYDYSKVEYKGSRIKVCIICPEHGEFWQTPHAHLNTKFPCKKCFKYQNKGIKYTKEDFIAKAKEKYGDKYDYSKVEYVNSKTKVCIICPEHGEFWQTPSSHLSGRGCNKCSKAIFNTKSFIEKSKEIHGNKYDYSKVNYINSQTKVCIICPEHGEFWQIPINHIAGKGCLICKREEHNKKQIYTTFIFLQKAKEIHGDKYDYSKVKYINSQTKVCIICPKHGEFWQTPNKHLMGEKCPSCSISNLELEVKSLLDFMNIKYIQEFSPKWVNRKRYDFCIEDKKILIECQGEQHYFPVNFCGKDEDKANENFVNQQKRDIFKYNKAIENGYTIIYYTKEKLKKDNEITDINELKNLLE